MSLALLVTGGRRYKHDGYVWQVLDRIHVQKGIRLIIHGATPTRVGADWAADDWSKFHNIDRARCYVDETLDGPWPAAGMRRNARMFDTYADVLGGIVAFPGGPGTENMVRYARRKGFEKIMDLRLTAPQ